MNRYQELKPSEFPEGSRLQRLWAELNSAKIAYESARQAFRDVKDQEAKARAQFGGLDLDKVSVEQHRVASAQLTFYEQKLTDTGARMRHAHDRLNSAQTDFQTAYGRYGYLLSQVRLIDPPSRPLGRDSVERRAAEVGRLAELEYQISYLIDPDWPTWKSSAA